MNNRLTALIAAAAITTILPADTTIKVGSITDITLSGLLAVGIKSSALTDVAPIPGRVPKRELRVDDNTSRFDISGGTSFAPGYKVIFQFESRFAADTRPGATAYPGYGNGFNITGLGDGETWAGISTPYGSLVAGKTYPYTVDTYDLSCVGIPGPGEGYRAWDGNGLALFNLLDQVSTTTALKTTLSLTRTQNTIRFRSAPYKGFNLEVNYSKNPMGDELKVGAAGVTADSYESGGMWAGNLRYNNGGFSASVSLLDLQNQGSSFSATHGQRAGVGYLIGQGPLAGFKVGVVLDKTSVDAPAGGYAALPVVGLPALGTQSASRTAYSVPVQYQWGKHGVYFTYTRAGNTTDMEATGAKEYNLGYDYALTKTVFVGLYYFDLKNDAKGIYAPFLSGSSFGPSAPNYGNALGPASSPVATGEGIKQIALCMNYWF
jgi:predicted porin